MRSKQLRLEVVSNQPCVKLCAIKTVAVVNRIANSCGEQAVIVTIITLSVKCEHWHKSSKDNKENLNRN